MSGRGTQPSLSFVQQVIEAYVQGRTGERGKLKCGTVRTAQKASAATRMEEFRCARGKGWESRLAGEEE